MAKPIFVSQENRAQILSKYRSVVTLGHCHWQSVARCEDSRQFDFNFLFIPAISVDFNFLSKGGEIYDAKKVLDEHGCDYDLLIVEEDISFFGADGRTVYLGLDDASEIFLRLHQ